MEAKEEIANQSQLGDSQANDESRGVTVSADRCMTGYFKFDQSRLVESRDADQSKALPFSIKVTVEINPILQDSYLHVK